MRIEDINLVELYSSINTQHLLNKILNEIISIINLL